MARPPAARGRAGGAEHQAYLAYEARQFAFWNAYSAAEAAEAPPAELLPNLDCGRSDAGLLGEIARQAQRANACQGAKLRGIADYALRKMANPLVGYDPEYMRRSVEAEVACQLKVAPAAASAQVHLALTLARRLPKTFAALERGELSEAAADLIADESADLDLAACALLEDAVLPDAGERSYRSLRTKVRREVTKLDADAVRRRAAKAKEDRTLYVKDEHDGMATLCLYVPAPVARRIFDAINDRVLTAQSARQAEAGDAAFVIAARDDRRVGAQRADTAVDLLAGALGLDPWASPVAVCSFLTAEQIARLNRGANTYTPSAAMKAAVRNRDKHCRFPGCRRPARHCDLDHTIPFVKIGGKLVGPGTVYSNLGAVRLSHESRVIPGSGRTLSRGSDHGCECARWRSRPAVVDAAVGAGMAA